MARSPTLPAVAARSKADEVFNGAANATDRRTEEGELMDEGVFSRHRLTRLQYHAAMPPREAEQMVGIWDRAEAGTSTPEDVQFLIRSAFHYAQRSRQMPSLRAGYKQLEEALERAKYGHGRSDFVRIVVAHANGRSSFVWHRSPYMHVGMEIKFHDETARIVSIEDCQVRRKPQGGE